MTKDRMQQSRFELKYHLTEEKALRVRDFVRCYISLDEYSVGKPNFSYPVHSLYLDSDELATYWSTINGDKNRFKLRIRYYDANPGSPVFFEVKRRMDHCIMKQRGGVRVEMVPWLLSGHHPEQAHLISKDPRQLVALQRFCQLMQQIHATPKVHIAYEREAYVSDDDSFRVTMDRNIRAEANLEGVIKTRMEVPALVYEGWVILELKFTDRFPNWYRELVEVFGLMQSGAAKYAEGVQGIGHRALGSISPVVDEEPPHLSLEMEPNLLNRPKSSKGIPDWVTDLA
ncbi:MAG: polyphosphate polymerase domain-containing protein [Verrucomicrobia bacterium]|nr:polyphosphate polymerase domain-containing protein [Verrucomicrobiota bacterium]